MKLPTALGNLLDGVAAARRRTRLQDATQALVDLRRQFEHYLAADDDDAADKVAAKIVRAEHDLRTAQMAVDATTRQANEQAQAAQRAEQAQRLAEFENAAAAVRAAAIDLDELLQDAVLAQVLFLADAYDTLQEKAVAARVAPRERGLPPLLHVWNRVFMRLHHGVVQSRGVERGPMPYPATVSRPIPSVAETWDAPVTEEPAAVAAR